MYDSYKRDITYMRISVTDRCNLRCIYCMPERGIRLLPPAAILPYEGIAGIAREASRLGISKIRLTGGEPLARKNIADLVERLKAIPGITEVALTTNALLLPAMAVELRQAGLDRLNISLDTLDPGKYRQITRVGNLDQALSGIAAAIAAGFRRIKINMVLIRGQNDDEIPHLSSFCQKNGLELQRIRRYSLQNRNDSRPAMEAERPQKCGECNRIRLTADGMLKPCLFSNQEIPVDPDDIAGSIIRCIKKKPLRGTRCRVRQNWQIGG